MQHFSLSFTYCACSKYAQQYASLSDSTSLRPSMFQDAEHASKPASGTCTHDAPSGDHRYMTELPVHTSNLACMGSHVMSVTLLFCSSTAVNSNFCISHTQTVVAMFSLKVTRNFPSLLQWTLPAYTELMWHSLQYSNGTSCKHQQDAIIVKTEILYETVQYGTLRRRSVVIRLLTNTDYDERRQTKQI